MKLPRREGVNMVHVAYRGGGQALIDLLGGPVQVFFSSLPSSTAYVRAGNLRALGVTTAMRSEALPDVPSIGDFVPGYEASGVTGLGAPKNTPADIIGKLNTEINAGLADPKIKARLADLGGTASRAHLPKWPKPLAWPGARLAALDGRRRCSCSQPPSLG